MNPRRAVVLLEEVDERQRANATVQIPVSRDQFHADCLRDSDVQGIVEGQSIPARQLDGRVDQLDGGDHELQLEIVQRVDGLADSVFSKSWVVEQCISDFIDEQVRGDKMAGLVDVGIPERNGDGRIRLFDEPLEGNRGVNDRHYRAFRKRRRIATLDQPGGALRRRRSMSSAARTIRARSRSRPLMSNATALVI